jgi:hypothetical protein
LDDEYELMPRKDVEVLRQEIERLKRTTSGEMPSSGALVDAINRLNMNLNRLNDILTGANDEMLRMYHDTSLQEQMRRILEQNEKLARGIVAVADMVSANKSVQQEPPKQPNPFADLRSEAPAAQPSRIPDFDVPPPPRRF